MSKAKKGITMIILNDPQFSPTGYKSLKAVLPHLRRAYYDFNKPIKKLAEGRNVMVISCGNRLLIVREEKE